MIFISFELLYEAPQGEGGRLLRGIKRGSFLNADWESFRGYYRRITKTTIDKECEEVNVVRATDFTVTAYPNQ
jgi:hypothetical protein